VGDGQELKNGTNPLKADVLKIDQQKPITLEGIVFETNKYAIRPESEEILMKAYNTMNAYPTLVVEISGHTDDVGKDAANQTLSENRAKAVRQWLISKGVDGNRIRSVGYGEKQPKVPNTSPENRQINRRIDFRIISR
jgi:outer membrane protein OmpA-like peptidoglycan-associated protein